VRDRRSGHVVDVGALPRGLKVGHLIKNCTNSVAIGLERTVVIKTTGNVRKSGLIIDQQRSRGAVTLVVTRQKLLNSDTILIGLSEEIAERSTVSHLSRRVRTTTIVTTRFIKIALIITVATVGIVKQYVVTTVENTLTWHCSLDTRNRRTNSSFTVPCLDVGNIVGRFVLNVAIVTTFAAVVHVRIRICFAVGVCRRTVVTITPAVGTVELSR
jgi:hypothetical protein